MSELMTLVKFLTQQINCDECPGPVYVWQVLIFVLVATGAFWWILTGHYGAS